MYLTLDATGVGCIFLGEILTIPTLDRVLLVMGWWLKSHTHVHVLMLNGDRNTGFSAVVLLVLHHQTAKYPRITGGDIANGSAVTCTALWEILCASWTAVFYSYM